MGEDHSAMALETGVAVNHAFRLLHRLHRDGLMFQMTAGGHWMGRRNLVSSDAVRHPDHDHDQCTPTLGTP